MNNETINYCIETLKKYGELICKGKETYITNIVTETSHNNKISSFALYIIAPEISYDYRAISVDIIDNSKLQVNYHTMKTKQTQPFELDVTTSLSDYENILKDITSNSLFKYSIEFIINQIELKREYKYPSIKDQIVPGQARIANIRDIGEIPVGFIRVDGNQVYYYTGQGLRTIWKPNMSEEEKKIAEELKKKGESELIKLGHIESRDIYEFIEIK